MKRIFLFTLANLAVLVMVSVIAHSYGFHHFINSHGLDFGALLAFAAVFGFSGAFLTLAISKWSAKMAVGARVIERLTTPSEVGLIDTVACQARVAGIGMPSAPPPIRR